MVGALSLVMGMRLKVDFEYFGVLRSSHLSFGGWRFGCGVLTRIEVHSSSSLVSFVFYYSFLVSWILDQHLVLLDLASSRWILARGHFSLVSFHLVSKLGP